MKPGKIFVSIASYRDPECQHTVNDLFAKAADPSRISVGICWQYHPEHDTDCFEVEPVFPERVRISPYHSDEAKGACWARVQALSLREDEDYVLMLDAHMRFAPGWDNLLIHMLEAAPTQPAVISAMPPNYDPPDKRHDHIKWGMPLTAVGMVSHPNQPQPVHLVSYMRPAKAQKFGLALSAFVVGNFIFSRAETFETVPFDPHIFFWGEEICYSIRLWTHGYDIYQPDRPVIYHHWFAKGRSEGEKAAYKSEKTERTKLSHARMRHLLFGENAPPEALTDMEKYGCGSVRPRDDFWAFAGVDLHHLTVAAHARLGRWTPYVPPLKTEHPRIFVSIASYRDPECQHTLRDLFAKAKYPGRVYAGVCWQFDPELDRDCFAFPPPFPQQVRHLVYHYCESQGGSWARVQALSLWRGEEYVLQIDAHMRFAPGWDEKMLEALAKCPGEKAALTCTVPNYNPPDDLEQTQGLVHGTHVSMIGYPHDLQPIHLSGWIRPVSEVGSNPLPTPFFVGNFLFAPVKLFQEVPLDPYISFREQEAVYSARLYTHGWNLCHPGEAVIYHHWHATTRNTGDAAKYKEEQMRMGKKRMLHLLGIEHCNDPKALADVKQYGMGNVRTLREFWEFAGVDVEQGVITPKAAEGKWYEAQRGAS